MSISLYFGLPGCGKTSLLTEICCRESYLIDMGQSDYEVIITNVPLKLRNVRYCTDFSWIGKYVIKKALIVIDEATIEYDSRNFKGFTKDSVRGFVLHRHMQQDVIVFCQIWDRVDRTIRDLCDRVYYLHKGKIFRSLTYVNHIPFSILFPDEESSKYGDILMGYKKCPAVKRIFSKRLWRPCVYGYYDTFWLPDDMKPLPEHKYLKNLYATEYEQKQA